MASCSACGKASPGGAVALKKCSVCFGSQYCSKECQADHWTSHKANCTLVATTALISAIQSGDEETVQRLAKTKRVVNGRVDYEGPKDDGRPLKRVRVDTIDHYVFFLLGEPASVQFSNLQLTVWLLYASAKVDGTARMCALRQGRICQASY